MSSLKTVAVDLSHVKFEVYLQENYLDEYFNIWSIHSEKVFVPGRKTVQQSLHLHSKF